MHLGQRLGRLWQWLGGRDRDYAALRRACRSAIVMPGMFALGDNVLRSPDVATFGAFGAFAMLLLVDFSGPMTQRLQAQVSLAVVGAVFICAGTAASASPWLAAGSMAVVGFCVLFSGVVSSTLATASTALLLAFILPVSLQAPVSAIPQRLAGWGLAAVAGLVAIAVLWPAPAREPLRPAAAAACEALAGRLRAEVAFVLGGCDPAFAADREAAVAMAQDADDALRRTFLATPYRPGGLRTSARAVTRLVAEVGWLSLIIKKSGQLPASARLSRPACSVKLAAAGVLERGAELLKLTGGSDEELKRAMSWLDEALTELENHAAAELPGGAGLDGDGDTHKVLVSALDPSFRAQEAGYAVRLIGRTIALTAAAERRSWLQRMLGRRPAGVAGTLSAAESRAAAHVQPHSVWLRNSIRGAAGLGVAVLVARLTGVQHAFWVVLGTLSVLRSNALSTGQDALRALAGTVVGLLIGAGILAAIGTNPTALWILLPFAVLLAGVAPAAISFTAGQAAFTLTLVILFNLVSPAGWVVGLLRLEDITLGCAVSIVVGLMFWPRGAGAALRQALADAYTDSAAYLASAVQYGILRCTSQGARPGLPDTQASRADAADRRLDDAFRAYLAEHGPKPSPLAEVTRLVTGVSALRLAAGAVLDLWRCDPGEPAADRSEARGEILQSLTRVRGWYDDLAASLTDGQQADDPLGYDQAADDRLIRAVRRDLDSGDDEAAATAVRIVWTGDHLDATRRLQETIAPAAHATARQSASSLAAARVRWSSHGRPTT
ncbi:MAG TPA: FUSC family protein [Streptosporangiaceae bacterium]|nr:FUSC family protein [Streptosporangiaceae bacterium]